MSIDTPAVFADDAAKTVAEAHLRPNAWLETTLTVLFTAVAVLFVSFVAVVAGIV